MSPWACVPESGIWPLWLVWHSASWAGHRRVVVPSAAASVPLACRVWRVSEAAARGGAGTSLLRLPVCRVPMGRQRGPRAPRWRQLLRAGCWWLLSLSGTALQGLRWLWRLAWVGTAGPCPQGPSCTHVSPKHASCPAPGVGALLVLHRPSWWCRGRWGCHHPCSIMAGRLGPSSSGVGSWLEALYGSAHQELWGCGDIAAGSVLPCWV